MPTILVEEAGWSQSGAGLTSSLFSMAGGFAALGAGFLAPKLGRRRSLLVPASGILSALSIAGLGYCLVSGTFGLVYLFISLVGIGLIAGEVVSLASAVDSVPMKFAGVANGFVLGAGFIIGGVGYPFALGSIKDATGSYAAGFVAITVVTLLACGVAQAFRREPITSGQDGILDPTVNAVGDSPRQATTTI
jgi:sugar phosphate permease